MYIYIYVYAYVCIYIYIYIYIYIALTRLKYICAQRAWGEVTVRRQGGGGKGMHSKSDKLTLPKAMGQPDLIGMYVCIYINIYVYAYIYNYMYMYICIASTRHKYICAQRACG